MQILLVTFTGSAFGLYSNFGLNPKQWLLSIFIGSMAIPVNLLLKYVKIKDG
jgi:hypothetical protein